MIIKAALVGLLYWISMEERSTFSHLLFVNQ